MANELFKHTTAEQSPYLRDGRVAAEEYEAAKLAEARCMAEAGFPVSTTRQGILIRLEGGPVDSVDAVQGWGEANRVCFERYSDDVESAWQYQHRPSEAEEGRQREAVLACVREHGIEVADYDLLGEMRMRGELTSDQLRVVVTCRSQEMSSSANE